MKDEMWVYAKELKDMKLDNLNRWPGYFMRKFGLTYKAADEAAEYYARQLEVGPYAPVKKEVTRERYTDS